MTNDKLDLYKERQERIDKAVRFEAVDKVPFTFLGPGYAPRSQGMLLGKFCTDADAAIDVTLDAMDSLDNIDGINMMVSGLFPCHLTTQWFSKVDVPGRQLPEQAMWQVHETEDMKIEDYDIILNQGWGAFLDYIYPKVHDSDLIGVHEKWMGENFSTLPKRYNERGYAILCSMITSIPFEALCGARSMAKFYFDCYRMPDKIKECMDIMQSYYIDLAVDVTNACGVKACWVGGWRSASAMVSPKIWDTMIFPYFLDMVTKLHENGIVSVLHFDQNWDRDIHRFLEFPKGACVFAPDGLTDIRKAREILGDHMAFLGDVPASLLAAGTPDEVYGYVSDLIRDIGGKGLIMNSGCDTPFNTPPENMAAFVAATHECGKLR